MILRGSRGWKQALGLDAISERRLMVDIHDGRQRRRVGVRGALTADEEELCFQADLLGGAGARKQGV